MAHESHKAWCGVSELQHQLALVAAREQQVIGVETILDSLVNVFTELYLVGFKPFTQRRLPLLNPVVMVADQITLYRDGARQDLPIIVGSRYWLRGVVGADRAAK